MIGGMECCHFRELPPVRPDSVGDIVIILKDRFNPQTSPSFEAECVVTCPSAACLQVPLVYGKLHGQQQR